MRRPAVPAAVAPLVALALASALLTAPAAAQFVNPAPRISRPSSDNPPPARSTGVIDGIVSDTTLRPIAFAEVAVVRTEIKLQTNAQGRFRFVDVPAGQYLIIVRRLGFRPVSAIIDVGVRDTVRLSYTLEPAVRTLDSVVVLGSSLTPKMQGFEERRKQGFGWFMTESDIAKRNLVVSADYLRLAPSISLAPISQGTGNPLLIAISKREGGSLFGDGAGACALQIVVDGVPMPPRFPLELLPNPKELAGIEVYDGPATVPAQFNGLDRRCGMVLVWTKDGR